MNDLEIISILSELSHKMQEYKKSIKYIDLFLKKNTKNLDKALMKWDCLEKLWKTEDAFNFYKQIWELHPYDKKIKHKIIELSK